MIHAYNDLYVEDAMHHLGSMTQYVSLDLQMDLGKYMELFLGSGIADAFGIGAPKYVLGMSGIELTKEVFRVTGFPDPEKDPVAYEYPRQDYWCGWILAYAQWSTGMRFERILNRMDIKEIRASFWPLHEAPESKFVEVLLEKPDKGQDSYANIGETNLRRLRKYYNYTQAELARKSGVSLRSIQMYEERNKDINKAQAASVIQLSKVLQCRPEELLEM